MKGLCEEKTIDSMITFENKVFVFRIDKYWVFESNEQNSEQPLGPLIEANIYIGSKLKGFNINKSKFTVHNNEIVAITANKWTEFGHNGKISKSGDIEVENIEESSSNEEIVWYLSLNI